MKRRQASNHRAPGLAVAIIAAGLVNTVACRSPARAPAGEQAIETAEAGHHQEKTMESPKRRIPAVAPVEAAGIRYEVLRGARARGFHQNGGIIAAIDVASGDELWTLAIYQYAYDATEEADVQDRYITGLALSKDHKHLLVTGENKQSYSVDLGERSITVHP